MDSLRRAVFLDRDGVLNRAVVIAGRPYPPASIAALEILPGVAEGLQHLRAAGFSLIGVTNQPDVARGTQTQAAVEAINRVIMDTLPLDEIRVCYHDDDARCACRKPASGLLVDAVYEHGIDPGASYMIGDRWRDVEAGRRAGCRTIFIDYAYAEVNRSTPDVVVSTAADALAWILNVDAVEEGR